jgi:acyl-CoA thioester hydrolase
MSEWTITYRGMVYPWHCDHIGHMNVMWYTGKFDEACWQLLAMLGLHQARFTQDGTGMVAVEQHTQYKRELHAGDAVTIQSTLLEVKDKAIHMLHKMVHDISGEVTATTLVIGVHIDAKIRKAMRLPEDVRHRALGMKEQRATMQSDQDGTLPQSRNCHPRNDAPVTNLLQAQILSLI